MELTPVTSGGSALPSVIEVEAEPAPANLAQQMVPMDQNIEDHIFKYNLILDFCLTTNK